MRRMQQMAVLTLALLAIHCGSRATLARKYYLMESDARVDTGLLAVPEPFLVNAYISPVEIAEPYRGVRIAQRSQSNELVYYYYHYWAEKPAAMATAVVLSAFEQAAIFKSCTPQNHTAADVMIVTEIDILERLQENKAEFARTAGRFRMVYLPSNTTMLSYAFDRRMRLRSDKSMNGFADAVSRALFAETEEFIFRVADYYQYPPE
ncbi:MAG TPA: ABC-type transport auxiliary lipoprotein family protein [bacterium]|nr:ABC-type transport auxiliary lipoprotein family protein [bacterium]HPR89526.1 ABC-type transport auxiliary lipoprotein family protein [bacterium]